MRKIIASGIAALLAACAAAPEAQARQPAAFDLDTLRTIKEAPIPGHNPDAIVYDPKAKHVFTFNGHSNDVSVLDADTLSVIAKITVPGKLEFAVNDGEGQLFANTESEPGKIVIRQKSADRYRTVGFVSTMQGARRMALDATTGKVYLVSAELGAAPAPTPERPHPRRVSMPDTATVLVVGAP